MAMDYSKFKTFEQVTGQKIPTERPESEMPQNNANTDSIDYSQFQEVPQPESTGKSAARSIYQGLGGYLKKSTWPADVAKAVMSPLANAYARDEMSQMGDMSQEEKDAYMSGINLASEHFDKYAPTQSNIERGIENTTGLPLQPRTTLDKILRLGGEAAGFRGGDYIDGWKLTPGAGARTIEKGIAGVAAPAISKILQQMGVPEGIADTIGLFGSQLAPVPKSIPTGTSPIMKTSGMPQRNFESVTKPTTISSGAHDSIKATIETDVRQATDKLFSEASPTYVEMKTNPNLRAELSTEMEQLKDLASGINRKVNTDVARSKFMDLVNKRVKTSGGLAQSEFDREFLKEVKILYEGMTENELASASEYLGQYRRGNVDKGKLFELGSSTARNEAKQEALRLQNQAYGDVIQTHYGQTTFGQKFDPLNKRWSAMEDADKAKNTIDNLFTPKGIKFSEAQKILKDSSTSRNLRRMVGKEKFGKLQEIARDFVNQGNKYKLLKPGKEIDLGGVGKDLLLFPHNPVIAGTSLANTVKDFLKGRGLKNQSTNLKWMDVPQNAKTGLQKIVQDVQ